MEILPAESARLSRETLIATGATAQVYTWGDGRVLKLFEAWLPAAKIDREFIITRAVHAAGVPAPAPFGQVQVGDRRGIVFQRIYGESLLRNVERLPWRLFRAAKQLADLHLQVHRFVAPEPLPTLHDRLALRINEAAGLTPAERDSLRRHAAGLPVASSLCHGDFHPANILLSARGPVIVDWLGAARGHPLGDVAATSVLFELASLPPGIGVHLRLLMKVARRLLHRIYLHRYLRQNGGSDDDVERWRVPHRVGWGNLRPNSPAGHQMNALAASE